METTGKKHGDGKILVVDDDPEGRRGVSRILRTQGYEVFESESGEAAMKLLQHQSVDVVLLDLIMPGIDGIETCVRIRKQSRFGRIPIVFVTASNDKDSRIQGMNAGCNDFLLKPVEDIELTARVRNLMIVRRYNQRLEADRKSLTRMVDEQTALLSKAMIEVGKAKQTVRRINEEIIFRLSRAVEFRDDETGNHVQRMSRYCGLISANLEMKPTMCDAIRIASALHDVGKIAIPDEILHKKGKLTDDEMNVMRKHAAKGYRLLTGSESALLELSATISRNHHERYDGTGYPRKKRGEAIPIEGRIASVADVFDALTSKRVYKPAFSVEYSIDILKEEKGKGFDPQVVDAFLKDFAAIKNIMIVFGER